MVNAFIEIWAMTLLVVLRRQLGRRYFTWWMAANGLMFLFLWPLVACLMMRILFPVTFSQWMVESGTWSRVLLEWGLLAQMQFIIIYCILAARHRSNIAKRITQGVDIYTQSIGEPESAILLWLPGTKFLKTPRQLECFAEPALSAVTGLLLLCCANWFGAYLLIGGLCLHLTAMRDFRAFDGTCMDLNDGRHVSDRLREHRHRPATTPDTPTVNVSDSPGEVLYPTDDEADRQLPPEIRRLINSRKKSS